MSHNHISVDIPNNQDMRDAHAQQEDNRAAEGLVKIAGGQEVWDAMMNHANSTWSTEYRDGFAEAITGSDPLRARKAVEYLRRDYADALGRTMTKQGF